MNAVDQTLLLRWMEHRDAEAFAEIVRLHSGMVFGTCKRILGNAQDAEEVAQECFLRLAEAHTPVRASLAGWLHVLATHSALNRIKAASRRRARELRYSTDFRAKTAESWDDIDDLIDESISALPEKLRYPVIAHFLEGQTQQSIARRLIVSQPTVARRIEKGIGELRKSLKRRGVIISTPALSAMLAANAVEATPATLVPALGKIALAGAGRVAANVSKPMGLLSSGKMLGSLAMLKSKIVLLGAIAALLGGLWVYIEVTRRESVPDTVSVEEQTPAARQQEESARVIEPRNGQDVPPNRLGTTPEAADGRAKEPDRTVVSGVIRDPNGEPIEGVRVSVDNAAIRSSLVADSGTYGRFTVAVDPYPGYGVSFARRGLAYQMKSVPFDEREGLEIVMEPEAVIEGIVVDASGAAFPEIEVSHHGGLGPPKDIFTDDNGAFRLEQLSAGTYGFWLYLRDPTVRNAFEGNPNVKVAAGQTVSGVRLIYTPEPDIIGSYTISGVVRDWFGEPIPGARVSVSGFQNPPSIADEHGYYEIRDLLAGTYTVTARTDGVGVDRYYLVNAGSTGVDFVLGVHGTIRGRVVDDATGAPIEEFRLRLSPRQRVVLESPYEHWRTCKDVNGRFETQHDDFCNAITVHVPGYFAVRKEFTTAADALEEEVIFRLEHGGDLSGIVVDDNLEPVFDAPIYVGAVPGWTVGGGDVATRSDGNGAFSLSMLGKGPVAVCARYPGFAPGLTVRNPERDDAKDGVQIVLNRGGTIRGKLTIDGEPVKGVVRLEIPSESWSGYFEHTSSETGYYTFEHVPPGSVLVYALVGVWGHNEIHSTFKNAQVGIGAVTEVNFDFPWDGTTVIVDHANIPDHAVEVGAYAFREEVPFEELAIIVGGHEGFPSSGIGPTILPAVAAAAKGKHGPVSLSGLESGSYTIVGFAVLDTQRRPSQLSPPVYVDTDGYGELEVLVEF